MIYIYIMLKIYITHMISYIYNIYQYLRLFSTFISLRLAAWLFVEPFRNNFLLHVKPLN